MRIPIDVRYDFDPEVGCCATLSIYLPTDRQRRLDSCLRSTEELFGHKLTATVGNPTGGCRVVEQRLCADDWKALEEEVAWSLKRAEEVLIRAYNDSKWEKRPKDFVHVITIGE